MQASIGSGTLRWNTRLSLYGIRNSTAGCWALDPTQPEKTASVQEKTWLVSLGHKCVTRYAMANSTKQSTNTPAPQLCKREDHACLLAWGPYALMEQACGNCAKQKTYTGIDFHEQCTGHFEGPYGSILQESFPAAWFSVQPFHELWMQGAIGRASHEQVRQPDWGFIKAARQFQEIKVPLIVFLFSLSVNLAYYMSLERGEDPDYPRNLAKCVTVKRHSGHSFNIK